MRLLRFTFPLIVMSLATAPTPLGAQERASPLIPREVLFGNPQRTSPDISPDGRQVAYLAPVNGVLNIWVRTLGRSDDHPVTSDTKRGIRSYFWQFDSRHLLYAQDVGGDENWRVYQTNVASRSTVDLTPFEKVRADIVGYERSHPTTLLVQLNRRDPRVFDVYRIDLATRAVTLDTRNPGDVASWQADHTLAVRAAQASTPDGGAIVRVRNNAGAPWRELMRWGGDETLGGIMGWSADNRALLVATSLGVNAARLLSVDAATGRQRVVVEDPHFDVGGIITNPRTDALEAVAVARQRQEHEFIDSRLASDFAALRRVSGGDVAALSRSLDDRRWIVTMRTDDAPIAYYLYDRPTQHATLLFSSRPALDQYRLAKMQPVEFRARDGMTLYGYLTTPAGTSATGLPMVVLVHGGPWGRDQWGYNGTVQWLANRGYAVMQVNFRGSTGYGKQYVNAGDRQWAGAMRTDLLDGKEWAVRRGVADPARVCIMGGSYGGYATLAALAFSPDAFTCGVDIVGPSNLNTLLKSIPPYWSTMMSTFNRRMGDTEALLTAQSPLFKAGQITAPLLVGQGANDPRVNRAEADQIVDALRRNGRTVEYYVFPDEGHGFARPENNKAFNAASERFLAQWLGGRAEPVAADEKAVLDRVRVDSPRP
ncbi:MAG: peptidase prolyl oligopeptidase [Gemmatimonadetes bacterium]|jgi:dipeptidyl aminopeptidase/acylaminoacyl peptidase|nr:peptidase prolyl oligopeptidase [Gemmatimonadota bacterium]